MYAVEAAFLALVFFTWISLVTLAMVLVSRAADYRKTGTPPKRRDAFLRGGATITR
jgi:hypothetical protein